MWLNDILLKNLSLTSPLLNSLSRTSPLLNSPLLNSPLLSNPFLKTLSFQDARSYQILFLTLFLVLGMATRGWALQPKMILSAIATCLITQVLASALASRLSGVAESGYDFGCGVGAAIHKFALVRCHAISSTVPVNGWARLRDGIPSAIITALGLSLLLRVDQATTMILASSVAILSKFLLRIQGKHLFNPANVGIIAALTLTQNAWVSPGQWGEEALYGVLFLGLGGIVLQRVGRWDTSVVFLVAYAGLEAARTLWLGWTWDVWVHRLVNGSLLLFALFMITDPRTIPNARTGRFIFALSIAVLTFVLRNFFFIPTAVFWSLFLISPFTVLLDLIFASSQFSWQQTKSDLTA